MITTHTLAVLEFDRVLALFAARAQSAAGREALLARTPFDDWASFERQRQLTREAIDLQLSTNGFASTSHDDVRPLVARLGAEGAVIEADELLQVARFLRVVRDVKTGLERAEHAGPGLSDLAEALYPSRDLETRITHAIGPNGEILDNASPKLAKLRRQSVSLRESLRQRLEGLFGTLGLSEDREQYVTFRGGRYVIPVPSRDRGKARGIVHDQSASGQTLFVEPFVVVEENNALSRCEAEAQIECRRILADLTARVADFADGLKTNLDVLARLDVLRAIAQTAAEMGMIVPDVTERAGHVRIVGAKHPVMVDEAGSPDDIVGLDLELGPEQRILILTGPNMGGKTVALKTLGLVCTMAACALPVLAQPGTGLPLFRRVCADIGDEQSISENLSTFASHLKHLGEFLESSGAPALILLDELGTGTDPAEGGALARAYLEALDGPETHIVATTHLGPLKDFAAEHSNAVNGSMTFDESTLSSRFTLDLGTPGRSRAFEVATRLAFPAAVLARARTLLSDEERRMDQLLADVEAERERLRHERQEADRTLADATERLREVEAREARARDILEKARSEAAVEVDRMLQDAEKVVKETRRKLVDSPHPAAREVEATGRAVREQRRAAEANRPQDHTPPVGDDYERIDVAEIAAGVPVWSLDLGAIATCDERPSDRGMVHISKGSFRIDVKVDRLRKVPTGRAAGKRPAPAPGKGRVTTHVSTDSHVPTELDLRGMAGGDVGPVLDQYLDKALLAGVGVVRIIHGKGTGVLRKRVNQVLSGHFGVISMRLGEPGEGGEGVTIVQLGDR